MDGATMDNTSADCLARQKWQLMALAAADPALLPRDVRVLIASLDFVHQKKGPKFGQLWPSIKTLADASATKQRSIQVAMNMLVARSYLVVVRRGGGRAKDGAGLPNVYQIGTVHLAASMQQDAPLQGGNGAFGGKRRVHSTANNPSDSTLLNKEEDAEEGLAGNLPSADILPFSPPPQTVKEPNRLKRSAKAKTDRHDNLGLLDAFAPTTELLADLGCIAPLVKNKLDLLIEQFKTAEWVRNGFQRGKYCDPARTFRAFILREEGYARDRTGGRSAPPPRKITALQAGSPEARRAYDVAE